MAYATFGTEPYMKVSLHTAPLLDSPCHGYTLYPAHYRQALASNPILLTHKPTVASRYCALVSYSVAREFMGGCLVPRSPFLLLLGSPYTPSYSRSVLWSGVQPPHLLLFPFGIAYQPDLAISS
jgi:hypothetical protein